ncbi:MAG TPA: tripartite tricarboxylate transporter substrate binding protein [Bordetella sp.]
MTKDKHTLFRMARSSLLGAGLALVAALPAHADDAYPNKPIHIVVPYTPGGAVDIVTRLVTPKMGEILKQSIIVDNRPGAATNIGMDYVTRQPADGYTLLTASPSLSSNGALFTNLHFDPAKAFAPVGEIGYAPLVVVVPAASPYKTLKDLMDDGRAHPEKLSFGTAGNGSSGHLAGELLKAEGKFNATHIPYKGGSPAITDLLGGRLAFMPINPLEVISHLKSGSLRALAVLDAKPAALLPDVPTAAQQGVPGAQAAVWWGLEGPAGMPQAVVDKLNAALQAALADPMVQSRMADLGATLTPGSAADFGTFVANETVKWTKVIKAADIKAD